ncbi:hypothetical protein QBC44DRAFT_305790 [Cladorrhinum sp. PSN332]|nr:hypothetical protein QBC44DRAFT_305790 [Cladorrhinum sp. PSN332]
MPDKIDATLFIGVDFNAATTGISAILFRPDDSKATFKPQPMRVPLQDGNSTIYTCPTRLPHNPVTGEYGYPAPAENLPWLSHAVGAPLTHLPIALNQTEPDPDHPAWRQIQRIHHCNYSPGTPRQKSIEACAEFLRRFWQLGILRAHASGLSGWQNLASIIGSLNKEAELPALNYPITKVRFVFAAPLPYTQVGTATHSAFNKAIIRSGMVEPSNGHDRRRRTAQEAARKSDFKILNVVSAAALGTLSLFGGIKRYKRDPAEPVQKGDAAVVLNIGELNVDIAAYKFRTPQAGKPLQIRAFQAPEHIISGEFQVRRHFDELVRERLDDSPKSQNDPRVWMRDAEQLWLQIRNKPGEILGDEHKRFRIRTRPNTMSGSFTIGGPTILDSVNHVMDWIFVFINGYINTLLANPALKKHQLKYFVVTGSFANFHILTERLKVLRPDLPGLQVIVPVQAVDAACLGAALYAYDRHLLRDIDGSASDV